MNDIDTHIDGDGCVGLRSHFHIFSQKVTLQGKFRFWDSKFREMKNRSVESVEKDRRLFHPSHSQNDDGDDE